MPPLNDVLQKLDDLKVNISITELQELSLACRATLKDLLIDTKAIEKSDMIQIQAILDYMHEQINVGNWKDVKPFLRRTITIASYLKLLAHIKFSEELTENVLRESLKIIDHGIIFGCPLEKEPKLLHNCASYLNEIYAQSHIIKAIKLPSSPKTSVKEYKATSLEILDRPSMEHFFENHILAEKPVILDNCISHWPALSKWQDQTYLIKLAGLRTVAIEIGREYTESDWTQKLMTVEEFINNHIYNSDGSTGYLAQYQLFDQVPELKNDITEPEYCCFSDSNDPVDIMAWYGPKGTVSPLHHDPKRNLLAQVVGEKQIFLFSPKDSELLYPHEHELLSNTARVDPRKPDLESYPKYKDAKPYYCILRPGQLLYIPPKWWHFVESLSVSFSVSFWWT
ncbi:bifunctional peptidase and arginyl-hydroxylase JMJD5 [Cydia strobilella]|uniref:bifunctional peptidase and arginyl-hydroxylase JMJD5 n=1 Tax=Cydia strobilella TaxID=1100964 RepID=UPI003007123A